MKSLLIPLIITMMVLLGCESNETKELSTSATSYKNAKGEIVVRESTQKEIDSLDDRIGKTQKINSEHPAPPTPLHQETFAVRSITEDGVFILGNNQHVILSGIKCDSAGVFFIRKFFAEDTERLAYLTEKETTNGTLEAYVWLVDTSMMKDPDMKQYGIGPSYSGVNDMVILNNWCEIEPESKSKYLTRYEALKEISREKQ